MGIIATAVRHLIAAGMTGEALIQAVEELEDTVTLPSRDASRDVSVMRFQAAERARKYRQRKRDASRDASRDGGKQEKVSHTLPKETLSLPSFLPEPLKERKPVTHAREDRFPDFWAAYPKRAGNRDRKAAEQAFNRAQKRGADPEIIIAGAKRYAAYCDAEAKTGTELVRQARTWLNADGWTELYEAVNGGHGNGRRKYGEPRGLEAMAIVSARIDAALAGQRADQGGREGGEPTIVELPLRHPRQSR